VIEAGTISLRDAGSGDEAIIGIRYDSEHVALFVSLKLNGDIQVVMGKEDAKRVMEALRKVVG